MSLRDQPYLPLYIQDFLTDEKLAECSAQSTGVYIRLMCLMHKSSQYGCILLKQKDKQNENTVQNFATKLSRQMPYTPEVIASALEELLDEDVIQINGDTLSQKRMVKDAKLSDTRAAAGKKSKKSTSKSKQKESATEFAGGFAPANSQANSENEIEIESEGENDTESEDETEIGHDPARKKKAELSHEHYAYLLATYLAQRITQRCPSVKPPTEKTLQQWADAFDKCNRIDGHSWEEMKFVLKFSQDDTFWQANILSGKKFREKYLQLLSKMQQKAAQNRPDAGNGTMDALRQLYQMYDEEEQS